MRLMADTGPAVSKGVGARIGQSLVSLRIQI